MFFNYLYYYLLSRFAKINCERCHRSVNRSSKYKEKRGRDVSTISRKRNHGTVEQIDTNRKPYKKYFPDVGARVYKENRKSCGNHSKVMKAWEFNVFAEKMILEEHWSPDAVVGYANRHKEFEYIPPTKTLYNYWIDEGKLSVINMDLALKLRRSIKSTKSRKHKKYLEGASKNAQNP